MFCRSVSSASQFVTASRLSLPELGGPVRLLHPAYQLRQGLSRNEFNPGGFTNKAKVTSTRHDHNDYSNGTFVEPDSNDSLQCDSWSSPRRSPSTTCPASASTRTRQSSCSRAARAGCPSTSTAGTAGATTLPGSSRNPAMPRTVPSKYANKGKYVNPGNAACDGSAATGRAVWARCAGRTAAVC